VSTLEEWTSQACRELGVDAAALDVNLVLDLARDVAHHVVRPAAPLTAYLLGVAVGRGQQPAAASAAVRRLALAWPDAGAGSG